MQDQLAFFTDTEVLHQLKINRVNTRGKEIVAIIRSIPEQSYKNPVVKNFIDPEIKLLPEDIILQKQ